ncbi:MAG: type II and III secretion system protein [Planctomycetes bacterium]|nr:type II and III secretion system protein [Planctomycetota bacterium]
MPKSPRRSRGVAWVVALAGCVSTGESHRTDSRAFEAAVVSPPQAGGAARGPLAWGLDAAASRSADVAEPQDPQETPEQRDARLRLQFGSSVLIGADGRVTKQYFLAGELGPTFLKLIAEISPDRRITPIRAPKPEELPLPGTKVGGLTSHSVLGRMLGIHEVEVTYVPDFEILNGAAIVDPRNVNADGAVRGAPLDTNVASAPSVALALVTAQPAALAAFEAALDLFYTSIPQVEITVTVVEYQTADALAFGVDTIDDTTPILGNLSSRQLVRAYTSAFPLRPPTVGTSPVTDAGLFTLGGIHDTWQLNLVLQALEANNLADIQSSPKLVVRNGGVAAVSTLTQVPFPKAKINQLGTEVATDIEFKPVGVKMNIIPVIAGTDSVILQVFADVSAITGFVDTEPVSTPITSTRSAVTTVYLKDGHTLVIGGLKSETKFESETKVPLLGDIPLLGFLFRSTSTSRNKTTVEFHITPRIVTDRGSPPSSR